MMGKLSQRENGDLLPPPHMQQCFSAVPTCSIPGQHQLKGTLRRHLCSCWITACPAVKCDLVIQGIALQNFVFRDDGDSAVSHRELLALSTAPSFLCVWLGFPQPLFLIADFDLFRTPSRFCFLFCLTSRGSDAFSYFHLENVQCFL